MFWFLIIAGGLLLLAVFIVVTPIEISIQFEQKSKKQDIRVKITVWYFFYKNFEIPVMSFDEETSSVVFKEKSKSTAGNNKEKDIKETPEELKNQMEILQLWLKHIDGLRSILTSFLGKIKIIEFDWKSEIGIGDAAWTGFLTGMLWSVKSMAAGIASAVFKWKCSPEMDIKPNFQKKAADTTFSCMFFMRLGHAIIAGIRVMKHMNGNVFKLWQKTKEETKNKEAS
ncbi:DUF2953 domain-containing protein [Alteribacillus bidgolensis]|uniref:DUF2953 domain-containing protein n=1 Tax=Alteribacillus bidgolensis TaxID=930129 RepID=A0A1G8EUT0_9BACI|nr:DUF2953 domain-containing protein [Alteribacillus bidgolensis]SDH73682.1 Protein of unknown function [Alteribacillus bidgolensis]